MTKSTSKVLVGGEMTGLCKVFRRTGLGKAEIAAMVLTEPSTALSAYARHLAQVAGYYLNIGAEMKKG